VRSTPGRGQKDVMKKILLVAMQSSVHTLRWASQLDRQQWDVHIFPADDRTIHQEWEDVTVYRLIRQQSPTPPETVTQKGFFWPFKRGRTRMGHYLKNLEASGALSPARRLARTIKAIKPDIIHVLEMQHAGYLFAEAAQMLDSIPAPVIYSSWGSDIFFFSDKPGHEEKIRRFLSLCQYHISDCERDLHLARQFGFTGTSLGVVPGMGGMQVAEMAEMGSGLRPSARNIIAIKGYHHDDFAGRSMVIFDALLRIAHLIRSYKILVYLVGEPALHVVPFVKRISGLDISILSKDAVPNKEILTLFGRARISVAMNVSDGTPNSLIESMAMGAFPVQSDTVSTGEWIEHGRNGFLVPPEDAESCAEAIALAVKDDSLVDNAASFNCNLIMRRIDNSVVLPRVNAMYRAVLEGTEPSKKWLKWPE